MAALLETPAPPLVEDKPRLSLPRNFEGKLGLLHVRAETALQAFKDGDMDLMLRALEGSRELADELALTVAPSCPNYVPPRNEEAFRRALTETLEMERRRNLG